MVSSKNELVSLSENLIMGATSALLTWPYTGTPYLHAIEHCHIPFIHIIK
jgi:hypothetical protein